MKMNSKNVYITPAVDVIRFEEGDVVTASDNGFDGVVDELDW